MRRTLALIAVLALVAGACGEDDASLEISDAWSRPATGPNGAVYLTIEGGDADTALTSVSVGADVAAMAQIHQTVMKDDGTMGMTMIAGRALDERDRDGVRHDGRGGRS